MKMINKLHGTSTSEHYYKVKDEQVRRTGTAGSPGRGNWALGKVALG